MSFLESNPMAKKKLPTIAGASPGRKSITTLKGSHEWAEWLEELAEHDRNSIAGLIDRALLEYAQNHGFTRKAPKR
jgi:hypothetical protein